MHKTVAEALAQRLIQAGYRARTIQQSGTKSLAAWWVVIDEPKDFLLVVKDWTFHDNRKRE